MELISRRNLKKRKIIWTFPETKKHYHGIIPPWQTLQKTYKKNRIVSISFPDSQGKTVLLKATTLTTYCGKLNAAGEKGQWSDLLPTIYPNRISVQDLQQCIEDYQSPKILIETLIEKAAEHDIATFIDTPNISPTEPSIVKSNAITTNATVSKNIDSLPEDHAVAPLRYKESRTLIFSSSLPREGQSTLTNKLFLKKHTNTTNEDFIRKEIILNLNNAILKFCSTVAIPKSSKVIFVFANHKEHTTYPSRHGGCRIISVMTEQEYIDSRLPESVDILVIKSLVSQSHGNYSGQLGNINSHRIAAMLMAYQLELSNCMFIDGNLESIDTQDTIYDWEALFDQLNYHRNNKVCLSISSSQKQKSSFEKNVVGSNAFMVDICQLKYKFPEKQDIFNLFLPNTCGCYWGEAYFMQFMIIQAFGHSSVSPADKTLFSLNKFKQNTSLYTRVNPVDEWDLQNQTHVFFNKLFNQDLITPQLASWIHSVLESMSRIVSENSRNINDELNRHLKSNTPDSYISTGSTPVAPTRNKVSPNEDSGEPEQFATTPLYQLGIRRPLAEEIYIDGSNQLPPIKRFRSS